jgi:hypothetical protein
MPGRLASIWLPRFLFSLSLALATILFLLVALAPLLDNGAVYLLALFAQDAVLRRTAIASAIGLAATAAIFFRPVR